MRGESRIPYCLANALEVLIFRLFILAAHRRFQFFFFFGAAESTPSIPRPMLSTSDSEGLK